jgi:hypothetical protein
MNQATVGTDGLEQEGFVEAEGLEQPKPKAKKTKEKKTPLAQPAPIDPSITVEQLQSQLNYAQKIINILQGKVNEANGVIVQLEARIQIADEDKQNILKQVEVMGITPQ